MRQFALGPPFTFLGNAKVSVTFFMGKFLSKKRVPGVVTQTSGGILKRF
jgi:hypothetical protein